MAIISQRPTTDLSSKYQLEERKTAPRPASPFPHPHILAARYPTRLPSSSPTHSLSGKLQILVPQSLENTIEEDSQLERSFNSYEQASPSSTSSSPLKALPLGQLRERKDPTSRLVSRVARTILNPNSALEALSGLNPEERELVRNNLTALLDLFPLLDTPKDTQNTNP